MFPVGLRTFNECLKAVSFFALGTVIFWFLGRGQDAIDADRWHDRAAGLEASLGECRDEEAALRAERDALRLILVGPTPQSPRGP